MSTGPTSGSGGTSGPGRALFALLDFMRAGRARSQAAAELAGTRGTSARPLTAEQREDNYRSQNGTVGVRLTPRQRRRAAHKANRAAARAASA